jgi:hypothetical protein
MLHFYQTHTKQLFSNKKIDQLFFQGIFSSVNSKCTCISRPSVQAQRTYTSNNDLSQKDRQIPPTKSASIA